MYILCLLISQFSDLYTSASKVASVEDGSDPSEDVDESDDGATGIKVYFNTDNDRLYHGNDIQYFEIEGEVNTVYGVCV